MTTAETPKQQAASAASANPARRGGKVCLIGAGFISGVHAEVLAATPGVRLTAVVDPTRTAAERLANRFPGARAFASLSEALDADMAERAHVLVPPDLHASVGSDVARAGIPVLVEKPLGSSLSDCDDLLAVAAESGTVVGVNQNFVFHPAFRRLEKTVRSGRIGTLRHVDIVYHMPLRQLAAAQFGHWMFRLPKNILLEQAVHPLSQLLALAGPVTAHRTLTGEARPIASGTMFYPRCEISLRCDGVTAHLHFAVGETHPSFRVTALCTDGIAAANILSNRLVVSDRTKWPDPVDDALSALSGGAALMWEGVANAAAFGAALVRLRDRSDPFYLSMKSSIASFHSALDRGRTPRLDGRFGRDVVALCEAIAESAFPAPQTPPASRGKATQPYDVAVLGGTGFIGRHLVRQLVEEGRSVGVMARTTAGLPDVFAHPRVTAVSGDVRNGEDIAAFIGATPLVINLAHGGGGETYNDIRRAMVDSAILVASHCREAGVRRLVHASTIAALYLGDPEERITGETPPDPRAEERALYARGKAEAERALAALAKEGTLGLVVLRPGLVIGEGTSPFHSGVGYFNAERHCLGWNRGHNPLPFVLAEDVADACILAAEHPQAAGRTYNLVGDVRPSARAYIEKLSALLHRPLRFYPQLPAKIHAVELSKWLIKRAGGRKAALPSYRDLRSRGLVARFDCSDAKAELGWAPVSDEALFWERGVGVHAGR